MSQNTIFVTGASGLVGQHLIPDLLSKNYKVVGLSRSLPANAPWIKTPNFIHVKTDFNGEFEIEKSLPKPEAIIHLAQSEFFREFPNKTQELFYVNTLSTLKLLNFARENKVKKFILASSGGVYGQGENVTELAKVPDGSRLNFYLNSRVCAELISENFESFTDIITFRFFFVYGPEQQQHMLIPRLVNSVRTNSPIQLVGESGIKINPIYVSDAVAAISAALSISGSHKINIGGREALSIREIGEIIGQAVKKDPIFQIQNGESGSLTGDITKMRSLLGSPKISVFEGITKYFQTLKEARH